MRIQVVTVGAVLLLSLAGIGARAQDIHVLRPAHGATVRESVPVKVASSDLPPDGYVVISIDGTFRVAQVLPASSDDPVFVWDTKAAGPNGTDMATDGDHTLKIDIYSSTSKLLGSDTVPVRVANQIAPPSPALKLTYHWTTQRKQTYARVTAMTVPGDQSGASGSAGNALTDNAASGPAAADQNLQSADLAFTRTTENANDAQAVLRDIVISGTVTSRGQDQPILSSYNIQPQLRTVNARGAVLSRVAEDDLMDHIGFPVPELPARRVGKGDRWLEPVAVPLNWDESTRANVTAECSLEGFEWQNNYPTAKIHETYSGPARFTSQPSTVSGHGSLAPIDASTITYDRVIYFAYGSGRLIKETTKTQITLTAAQLTALGGTPPGGPASPNGPGGYTNPNAGTGYTNPNAGTGYTNPNAGTGYTNPNAGAPGNPGFTNQSFTGSATLRLIADDGFAQDVQYGGPPQGYPGYGQQVPTNFTLVVTQTNTLQTP